MRSLDFSFLRSHSRTSKAHAAPEFGNDPFSFRRHAPGGFDSLHALRRPAGGVCAISAGAARWRAGWWRCCRPPWRSMPARSGTVPATALRIMPISRPSSCLPWPIDGGESALAKRRHSRRLWKCCGHLRRRGTKPVRCSKWGVAGCRHSAGRSGRPRGKGDPFGSAMLIALPAYFQFGEQSPHRQGAP